MEYYLKYIYQLHIAIVFFVIYAYYIAYRISVLWVFRQ